MFDAQAGLLNFESLQSVGSDQNFKGSLKPLVDNGLTFKINEIQTTDVSNRWHHSGKYDPDFNILYIPKVSITNLLPPNINEYDLFFGVNFQNNTEIIKLLEIDPPL